MVEQIIHQGEHVTGATQASEGFDIVEARNAIIQLISNPDNVIHADDGYQIPHPFDKRYGRIINWSPAVNCQVCINHLNRENHRKYEEEIAIREAQWAFMRLYMDDDNDPLG